jgi:hypothetical protein
MIRVTETEGAAAVVLENTQFLGYGWVRTRRHVHPAIFASYCQTPANYCRIVANYCHIAANHCQIAAETLSNYGCSSAICGSFSVGLWGESESDSLPQNKGPVHLGTGPTPCREHQKSRLRSGLIQEEDTLPPPRVAYHSLNSMSIAVSHFRLPGTNTAKCRRRSMMMSVAAGLGDRIDPDDMTTVGIRRGDQDVASACGAHPTSLWAAGRRRF